LSFGALPCSTSLRAMYRKVLYNTCHNVPWVYCTNLLGSILITTTHTHTHCVISTGAGKAGIHFFYPLSIFLLTCVRRMRRAGKGGGSNMLRLWARLGEGATRKALLQLAMQVESSISLIYCNFHLRTPLSSHTSNPLRPIRRGEKTDRRGLSRPDACRSDVRAAQSCGGNRRTMDVSGIVEGRGGRRRRRRQRRRRRRRVAAVSANPHPAVGTHKS